MLTLPRGTRAPVQPHLQAVANQTGRGAVQNGTHGERAAARDPRFFLDEVSTAAYRQLLQLLALNSKRRRIAPITPHHHLAHEALIRQAVIEVAVTTQQQCLLDCLLQIPVRRLDATVLMAQAAIVVRAGHAVVLEQRRVAHGEVLFFGQILEGGR